MLTWEKIPGSPRLHNWLQQIAHVISHLWLSYKCSLTLNTMIFSPCDPLHIWMALHYQANLVDDVTVGASLTLKNQHGTKWKLQTICVHVVCVHLWSRLWISSEQNSCRQYIMSACPCTLKSRIQYTEYLSVCKAPKETSNVDCIFNGPCLLTRLPVVIRATKVLLTSTRWQ